jgi:integral membrane protein
MSGTRNERKLMSDRPRTGTPSPEKLRRSLAFYKVMALIAGTAVLILAVVVIIRYGFGNPGPSKTWSPIHGWLYMLYAASVINLGFTLRWSLGRMVLTMLAGALPVVPWFLEAQVVREVKAEHAGSLEP